jgi:hypothetical protein
MRRTSSIATDAAITISPSARPRVVSLAKGPVNNIHKLVPLCKPLFAVYREMIAEKDAAAV